MTKLVKYKERLRPAGGYVICAGCREFPNLSRQELRPWRKAVRSFILRKVKQGDADVIAMIREAECYWLTFECKPFNHWAALSPVQKSEMLIAHILRQGREKPPSKGNPWVRRRYTALDILVNSIAADLWVTYGPSKLKSPYYRAVSIGRSVWFLLRAEFREYTREHNDGTTSVQRICITKKVRMRSRYACQRVEAALVKQGLRLFVEKYGYQIALKVQGLE